MTWPFENDTSAITKKLANRSIKADKRRNIFIIVTITHNDDIARLADRIVRIEDGKIVE